MANGGRQRAGDAAQGAKQGATTRQRILYWLRTARRLSAAELAQKLDLTEMAVRRHIHVLEREGKVCIRPLRQSTGRPLHLFELTAEADDLFPKNYHALTLDLLAELDGSVETKPLIDRMFQGRRHKLEERYSARMAGKSLQQRVQELADIQNASGYMAETDHGDNGVYMLHEYNCPIAQVADKYEQACSCELALFQALLETSVKRTECLAKGGSRCSYMIGNVGAGEDKRN